MDTPAIIIILILLALVVVLGHGYVELDNEIGKLKHALRLSNAQNRADAREINDLKCELTKTKHDYACQVADCKCGKPEPKRANNDCLVCQGEGTLIRSYSGENKEVECEYCKGTGQSNPLGTL